MAGGFRCSIVTPTRTVLDEEVTYASFPAWDGQHGVIPGQSPMLSRLGIGALRLDLPAGGSRWYLLEGGFAQVRGDTLTLLTNEATPAQDLSVAEADAALAQATGRVAEDAKDRAAIDHEQQRALAARALARTHGAG